MHMEEICHRKGARLGDSMHCLSALGHSLGPDIAFQQIRYISCLY